MPTTQDAEEFVKTVAWWQGWEIVPGVMTTGAHVVASTLDLVRLPGDLSGKRVLDIGGWNGCFSFECERRGAAEVVMLEPTPSEATFFEAIKAFLGSKVSRVSGTVYDLDPDRYGHFDVVLFFGVVYHLRYPLLAVDNIRRVCRGDLYTESAVLDEAAIDPNGGVRGADSISVQMNRTPLFQFAKGKEYFNDTTNWFIPNRIGLDALLEAGGFTVGSSVVTSRYYSNASLSAGEAPMFTHAHEGFDYDLHVRHLLGDRAKWPQRAE